MAEGVETSVRTRSPAVVPRWLWMLSLLVGALTILQSFGVSYMGSGLAPPRGVTGLNALSGCGPDRFCTVSAVTPNSAAAHAGVAPNDRVRLDRPWERRRTLSPGEHVGVTVRHDGQARHIDLVTTPRPFAAPTFVVAGLASVAVCLIAMLILARAGRRWWSFLLGCSLISVGIPGGSPRSWQNDSALFQWVWIALALAYMAGPVLMLAALRGFRKDVTGRTPRWLDGLLWLAAAGALIATVWGTAVELDSAPVLGVSNGLLVTSLAWSLGSLLGPLALAAGWRNAPPASRTRYAFMWIAVSVSSIHPILDPIVIAMGNKYNEVTWPVVVQLAATICGAVLFAYAILRHRVIDIGFVINRTLVYSTLSFLTLLTFGLVEWASEKFAPFESHEASVVVQAGVALTVFLVFHHIHAWIEGVVERLFFHHWRANEAALHNFLREAGYVTRAEILSDRAVEELKRFSGGATVAFYRSGSLGYELAGGDAVRASVVDADTPALVTLRAGRRPVRDGFADGDIVLPMTHRAEVTGFIVLGPKPGGDAYRSDEETLLADAAGRIGLDLYALRVEELQETNARLTMELQLIASKTRTPPAAAAV
ncbi:hypothetical protein BH09PSE2_BH09PSE2_02550 [soil metagenome]